MLYKILNKKKFYFSFIFFLLTGCFSERTEGIYPYNAKKDRDFILKKTAEDHFWLIADEATGYRQQETLDTGIHPFVHVPVHFYLYYKDKKPVAFISYYCDSSIFANIQFVYVDKDYRRQGIAEKLITFVLDRLRNQGIRSVEICTRLINTGARSLYEKIGFNYLYDTGKYIYLTYSLHNA